MRVSVLQVIFPLALITLGSSQSVFADVSYSLESSGKDEASALGNLKMAALREYVSTVVSKDDLKKNSKVFRNEIFLKVNNLTKTDESVEYRKENKKTFAKGTVIVDDSSIQQILTNNSILTSIVTKNKESSLSSANPVNSGNESPVQSPSSQSTASVESSIPKSDDTAVTASLNDKNSDNSAEIATNSQNDLSKDNLDKNTSTNEPVSQTADNSQVQSQTAEVANNGQDNIDKSVSENNSSNLIPKSPAEYFKQKGTREEKIAELKNDLQNGHNPNGDIYAGGFVMPLLIFSLKENDPDLVKLLVSKGADVNKEFKEFDDPPASPLYYYLDKHQMGKSRDLFKLEIVKILVEGGADIGYKRGKHSVNELMLSSPYEIQSYYLSLSPDLSDYKDVASKYLKSDSENPHHLEVFTKLLSLGADPNYMIGKTPLLLKAYEDKGIEYAKAILDNKANPNIEYSDKPIIFEAVEKKDLEFIKLLISSGADINAVSKKEETPLLLAIEDSLGIDLIKGLLDLKADPNLVKKDDDNKSPLMYAIEQDSVSMDIIDALISHGANVNAKDTDEGFTPLLYAIESGKSPNIDVIKKLLEAGADPNVVDADGYPVIVHAFEAKSPETVKLLVDKGVDLQKTFALVVDDKTVEQCLKDDDEDNFNAILKYLKEHN